MPLHPQQTSSFNQWRGMLLWSCFCDTRNWGSLEEILKMWKRDWCGAQNGMRQVWHPGCWFGQLVVVPLSKRGERKRNRVSERKNGFWTFVVWIKQQCHLQIQVAGLWLLQMDTKTVYLRSFSGKSTMNKTEQKESLIIHSCHFHWNEGSFAFYTPNITELQHPSLPWCTHWLACRV